MQIKALPVEEEGGRRRPARYVALSYVWGTDKKRSRYMTKISTVMRHVDRGGLSSVWRKLPKTIQDAILLVSRLGLRYIWIDSLCIVQNSRISWRNNARAMHLIYGHADFTICAADGDADSGLRAAEPLLRTMPTIQELSKTHFESSLADFEPLSVEYAPRTRVLVTRPLEVVIYDSAWSKQGRMYFQCRFAGVSEDIWTDGAGNGWSLNRTNSPLQSPEELKRRPIWFYMRYVRMYTSRNLTKPTDILEAFQGITWLLQEHMNGEQFLFGLPTSHFDLALLWIPTKPLLRRKKAQVAQSCGGDKRDRDEEGECSCEPQNDDLDRIEFPSWAWCGWMGEGGTGGHSIYHEEVLEGSLSNIRQWLEHHTWIKWCVRDEKGHLRPLRDDVIRVRGREIYDEDRWNGYSGSKDWTPMLENAVDVSLPRSLPTNNNRKEPPKGRLSSSSLADRSLAGSSRSQGSTRAESRQIPGTSEDREGSALSYRVGSGAYLRRGSIMEPKRNVRKENTYGPVRPEFPQEVEEFGAIIPDNPFGILKEPQPSTYTTDDNREGPPLQYMRILQFYTWLTEFYVTVRNTQSVRKSTAKRGLVRCDIADDAGEWCGSIEIADEWISSRKNRRFHFIAISEAKAFTTDECPIWTYYIPRERGESQWDVFYVLLLERDRERCLWERIALGKVFQAAFVPGAEWSEIKLG